MQRTIKIIVVCLAGMFYGHGMQAQSFNIRQQLPASIHAMRLLRLPDDSAGSTIRSLNTISSDYYTRHFGFFCDKELKLEKTTGVPFRFRLGSMEHCNKLEGKK